MKRVNGIITEATEAELLEVYSSSNWKNTVSFDSFKKVMIDEGCKLIEVDRSVPTEPVKAPTIANVPEEKPSTTSATGKQKIIIPPKKDK